MNNQDIERFKGKLLEEKRLIETELATIGKRDPASPGGWDATSGSLEVDAADDNEVADRFEEIEDNNVVVSPLEEQLKEINAALDRIAAGTYGKCEVSGEQIEMERLEANPSARTTVKHSRP